MSGEGETLVVKTGEKADDTTAQIAEKVGALGNEAAHAAEKTAEHAEAITHIKEGAEWATQRMDSLARATEETATSLRSEMGAMEERITSGIGQAIATALSQVKDGSSSQAESGDNTRHQEEVKNPAKPKKKGLLGLFRRLI